MGNMSYANRFLATLMRCLVDCLVEKPFLVGSINVFLTATQETVNVLDKCVYSRVLLQGNHVGIYVEPLAMKGNVLIHHAKKWLR